VNEAFQSLDPLVIRFWHAPGVRFPGLTHPGVVGTAPSLELLNIWNEREKSLCETSPETIKLCEVLHQRPLAHLPTPENCLLGKA
jgi:formamidase